MKTSRDLDHAYLGVSLSSRVDPSAAADRRTRRRKFVRRKSAGKITARWISSPKYLPPPFFGITYFMCFLRLQTSIVWFFNLFGEGPMCMCKNFKLLCCAAYILNLIVSIYLSCWPNLWYLGVFSAEFLSFRKNSANPDISRKYGFMVFEKKSGWGVQSRDKHFWANLCTKFDDSRPISSYSKEIQGV